MTHAQFEAATAAAFAATEVRHDALIAELDRILLASRRGLDARDASAAGRVASRVEVQS